MGSGRLGALGPAAAAPAAPSPLPRFSNPGWRAFPSLRFMKEIKPGSWMPKRRIFIRTRIRSALATSGWKFFGPGEEHSVKGDSGLFNTKTRVLTLKGQVEMQRGDLIIQPVRPPIYPRSGSCSLPRMW